MTIIIGLGPGRAGTASLSQFLDEQPGSFVTHELNPASMMVRGTFAPIKTMIREFTDVLDGASNSMLTADLTRPATVKRLAAERGQVTVVGDVAFYYLAYVEKIAKLAPGVRFLCMQRDRASIVRSFLAKTLVRRTPREKVADRIASLISGRPYYSARNHWIEHDGSVWLQDPLWDKLFPKFEATDREDAVRRYVDWYYDEAERLASHVPNFHMIPIEMLNDTEGQRTLLQFAGIVDGVLQRVHANAG